MILTDHFFFYHKLNLLFLYKGVRYNAEKRRVGAYYSTPIYKFRMKCALCDQFFEIRTDPKVSVDRP